MQIKICPKCWRELGHIHWGACRDGTTSNTANLPNRQTED